MEIRTLQLGRGWVQRLVRSVRYFGCVPNLDENVLREAMDQPRIFIGFVQAHNLAIRGQCEMLDSSATRKLEIHFPFCSSDEIRKPKR